MMTWTGTTPVGTSTTALSPSPFRPRDIMEITWIGGTTTGEEEEQQEEEGVTTATGGTTLITILIRMVGRAIATPMVNPTHGACKKNTISASD